MTTNLSTDTSLRQICLRYLTIDKKYKDWIDKHKEEKALLARCSLSTDEMVEAFPELEKVAGTVRFLGGGGSEHFWCVTPSGDVVDPTVSQFDSPVTSYRPFEPGDEVYVDKCMNCGMEIYKEIQDLKEKGHSECMCSDECEKSFVAWQNGEEDINGSVLQVREKLDDDDDMVF